MKRGIRNITLVGLLIPLLLGACVLPTTHRYNILFTFETPSDGETYPVFSPIHINMRVWVPYPPGYRPYYGPGGLEILNEVTIFANGLEIGSAEITTESAEPAYAPGVTGRGYHAFRNWVPPRVGLYYLQAHAILMMGSPVNADYSPPILICVVDSVTSPSICEPTATPTPTGVVPLSAPFSFSTPTSTPASARDCPSGTFFAEQTHQCLPIQILPTKKASGCAKYDNASACTSNGCSWDKPSSTCH